MRKVIGIALSLFASNLTIPAWATTPGVNDVVTAIRMTTAYPHCAKFQTVNGGGNTDHTWNSTATVYGISDGSAVYGGSNVGALGSFLSGVATAYLVNSRLIGNSTSGPYIQFSDAGAGTNSDCPSTVHGVDFLDQ